MDSGTERIRAECKVCPLEAEYVLLEAVSAQPWYQRQIERNGRLLHSELEVDEE